MRLSDKMKKVMIFHPGQQHSYRLATALNDAGILACYCTTVYNKPGSLTSKILPLLKGNLKKRAELRQCDEICDSLVVQFGELLGLITIVLSRMKIKKFYKKWNQFVNDYCGRKAAKYAIKNNIDCVISYNNNSKTFFELISKKAPRIIRIMDASAANVLYMKDIYEHDMQISPKFKKLLHQERGILWEKNYQKRIMIENTLAQYIFVASEFVKKTYTEFNFPAKNIFVCPYGIDLSIFFPNPQKKYNKKRPIKCIYVGGTKELKGISYLLEAFMDIPKDKAILTVVGINTLPIELGERYNDKIEFTGSLLHDEVAAILREKDVMIFPSLGDGFSFAVLEAMASGLPIIASKNVGSSELIENGRNGFVIPIQDKTSIINAVYWFVDHFEYIGEMGINARASVEFLSWQAYGEKIKLCMREISRREKK